MECNQHGWCYQCVQLALRSPRELGRRLGGWGRPGNGGGKKKYYMKAAGLRTTTAPAPHDAAARRRGCIGIPDGCASSNGCVCGGGALKLWDAPVLQDVGMVTKDLYRAVIWAGVRNSCSWILENRASFFTSSACSRPNGPQRAHTSHRTAYTHNKWFGSTSGGKLRPMHAMQVLADEGSHRRVEQQNKSTPKMLVTASAPSRS
jgi:hypothetical protein